MIFESGAVVLLASTGQTELQVQAAVHHASLR